MRTYSTISPLNSGKLHASQFYKNCKAAMVQGLSGTEIKLNSVEDMEQEMGTLERNQPR